MEQAVPSANEQIWNRIVSNRILLRVSNSSDDDNSDRGSYRGSDRSSDRGGGRDEPAPVSLAPRDGATGHSAPGTAGAYPGGISAGVAENWEESRANNASSVRSQAIYGSLVMSSKHSTKSVAVPW
ncbi:hypothetical protein AYI69_g3166 [Smittium culicis]|uniref:Uncharacterized protein n=1 Tax=Smittium culicis TaxID=133412 RepID=A0A1R1YKE7_9FUNG|nr:hypothetical protein AYI69_g3166 [Smittium culicis]